jgi:hypothetical protein
VVERAFASKCDSIRATKLALCRICYFDRLGGPPVDQNAYAGFANRSLVARARLVPFLARNVACPPAQALTLLPFLHLPTRQPGLAEPPPPPPPPPPPRCIRLPRSRPAILCRPCAARVTGTSMYNTSLRQAKAFHRIAYYTPDLRHTSDKTPRPAPDHALAISIRTLEDSLILFLARAKALDTTL